MCPSRACITANVISSASLIFGGIPTRRAPRRPFGYGLQQIVGSHVQCRREGVQVSVHESLLLIVWVSNADLGHPLPLFGARHAAPTPWNCSLHFDRDAATLLEALTSAIRDVESTGLTVCAVASDDVVSLRDIARRTGRTYEAARLWASGQRGPGGFPPPVTAADGWSLYSWAQVSEWLRTNLLAETAARPDDRILAAVDHLIQARCLLDNRGGLTALAELLTPRGRADCRL